MASKVVLSVAVLFDVTAFALAIAAEQRRSTATVVPDDEKEYTYCAYDSDIATGLGVGAFLLLMASQILIVSVTRCYFCGPTLRWGKSRSCAVSLFLSSWLTFLVAEICLLTGSVRNAYHTAFRGLFFMNDPSCEVLRKGVFASGAAFAFLTTILAVFYYILYDGSRYGYADEEAIG
ncbi:uncharacterized protein LOC121973200 [Zingiber officinale]|uniref:Fiber protein Fb34 n=1 Tax=Zingiber officinale TaxID=94328 RepID=A0A8J5LCV8_ZINOF|nr:uncharacterized protein LOC121973200 [Zingiber officinale]KAG6513754.1 hypothetical protein ZIOFF_024091 [Zingiber officinale]